MTQAGEIVPSDAFSARSTVPPRAASIAVCLVARDVAAHIPASLGQLMRLHADGEVAGIYVVDGGSTDATAAIARDLGARVFDAAAIHPEMGPVLGKGDSMWRAASHIDDDVIIFLDADIDGALEEGVRRLIGAVQPQGGHSFVKGCFRRSNHPDLAAQIAPDPLRDGRVTECLVRPLFAALAPEYSHFREPLSGQIAITRALLRRLPVVTGYGVEIGMLLDVISELGPDGVGEVDLGVIYNPPQSVDALGLVARDVAATLMERLARHGDLADQPELRRRAATIGIPERPPLASLA